MSNLIRMQRSVYNKLLSQRNSAHKKLKYFKKRMKAYGQLRHDLAIAKKALLRIQNHYDEFNQGAMDDLIDCRMIAVDALRQMKGK